MWAAARVPDVYAVPGGVRDWPLVRVAGLRVGGVPLGPRGMGLTDERACSVTLGADVLAPYAFTVDPLRREVTFEKSRPRAEYLAEAAAPGSGPGRGGAPARADAGAGGRLAAAGGAGDAGRGGPHRDPSCWARASPSLGSRWGPRRRRASNRWRRPPICRRGPTWWTRWRWPRTSGVKSAGAGGRGGVAQSRSTLGRLGPDVWGRFRATVDVQGDTLVLRRPRVQTVRGPPTLRASGQPGSRGVSRGVLLRAARAPGHRGAHGRHGGGVP